MTKQENGWPNKYIDWKTLTVGLAIFAAIFMYGIKNTTELGDKSVYKQTGTIEKVEECSQGKGVSTISVVDEKGREIDFGLPNCKERKIKQFSGKGYVAHFSRKESSKAPIQLSIEGGKGFKAGVTPAAVIAKGFVAAAGAFIFGLIFMLLRHFLSRRDNAA